MILVDTSIWLRSLRREGVEERRVLDHLLDIDQAATTDLVIAEVLQGARSEDDYQRLARRMDGPHFFHASETIWMQAARMSFELKQKGLITPLSDLVIACVALENVLSVYTVDAHFERVSGLELYTAGF